MEYSQKHRTYQSGDTFFQGVSGDLKHNFEIHKNEKGKDRFLRFFDDCQRYIESNRNLSEVFVERDTFYAERNVEISIDIIFTLHSR